MTFDSDDYELRWPPQLFVDEANRLVGEDNWRIERDDSTEVGPDIEWLLTEAFLSTAPVETFRQVSWGDNDSGSSSSCRRRPVGRSRERVGRTGLLALPGAARWALRTYHEVSSS